MREALAEAAVAAAEGEIPVGAVVVDQSGQVLGRGRNCPVGTNDPTGHAEITALRRAAAMKGNYRLNGCVLIVTLEPCLMCAGAIIHARLGGIVYGASDLRAGAVASCLDGLELPMHNHAPWHAGGILERECASQLHSFFASRRTRSKKAPPETSGNPEK